MQWHGRQMRGAQVKRRAICDEKARARARQDARRVQVRCSAEVAGNDKCACAGRGKRCCGVRRQIKRACKSGVPSRAHASALRAPRMLTRRPYAAITRYKDVARVCRRDAPPAPV